MRIGVICPADIAVRRFLPALKESSFFEFAGVAVYKAEERFSEDELRENSGKHIEAKVREEWNKAEAVTARYGGIIYDGFQALTEDPDIDAVYIPLPPALHFKWGKRVLLQGKHVFMEKPFCTKSEDTKELVSIAEKNDLTVYENYMFLYHAQIKQIDDIIRNGEIGHVRLYRMNFGFPKRPEGDFRYKKEMGGGALLDAGGYALKYASYLMGRKLSVESAVLHYTDEYNVDLFGSGTIVNPDGLTAQISFGMDNQYKCEFEAWGSSGYLKTGRIFTAPKDFVPKAEIERGMELEERVFKKDDSFYNSIQMFGRCIQHRHIRKDEAERIVRQSEMMDKFVRSAKIFIPEGKKKAKWEI